MRIGQREIGPEHPPYIIAEIGVNHDGSVERAIALTELAANAGADAVKLQLFKADLLMSKAAKLAAYQTAAGESDPIQMLRRLELSAEQMAAVVDRAHQLKIHAIVSVFSVELVAEAERLPWDAYKAASPDIINRPLLDALAGTGKPIVLSTGASTLDEVRRALGWLAGMKDRLAVLQCVSSYPTLEGQEELGGMKALRTVFSGPVGYSDHTPASSTSALAVLCGAELLEKHLTYDRGAGGPDHAASLDEQGIYEYVGYAINKHEDITGDDPCFPVSTKEREWIESLPAVKRVLPIEQDVRHVSRQSLTTARPLTIGHTLTRADLTIKRPGTGLEPFRLDEVVGRRLARAVEGDMPVMAEDLV
jgi:N,N'-diacetyllegionaminate synthase